jgi:O-antigen ligase
MVVVAAAAVLLSGKLRPTTALVAVASGVLWLGVNFSYQGPSPIAAGPPVASARPIQSNFSSPVSDQGRWAANWMALQQWSESPLLGIGLGGFLIQSETRFSHPMIIHSTPIWILAEFGLLGAGFLVFAVVVLGRPMWSTRAGNSPPLNAMLLILVMFAVFCQFHEMLYQRFFWLYISLLAAEPTLFASMPATTETVTGTPTESFH